MISNENKIESTLHSIDYLQRLEVPFNLKQSIKSNFTGNIDTIKMNTSQKLMLVASLTILLGLNVFTMNFYFYSSNKNNTSNEKNFVYKEYFSNSIEHKLYQ